MTSSSGLIRSIGAGQGRGAQDTAAVCAVLEKMAGVKRGKARKAR
jgi:hypothetical protein